MTFNTILDKIYGGDRSSIPNRLLCLDPGNTTGWSLWIDGELAEWGQIVTYEESSKQYHYENVKSLMEETKPTVVHMENYRVYSHKLDRHTFSEVPTVRIIGAFSMMCQLGNIPTTFAMATDAKHFVTDEKLKKWGFWKDGMRHARDSIRHGIYHLVIMNKRGLKNK